MGAVKRRYHKDTQNHAEHLIFQMVTSASKQAEKNWSMTHFMMPLTGLPNRMFFYGISFAKIAAG